MASSMIIGEYYSASPTNNHLTSAIFIFKKMIIQLNSHGG